MFELSGNINGTTYDKTTVSADQLVDMFKLGLKRSGYFMVSDLKKRKEPKIFRLTPVIRGNYNGNSVEVRYYTAKNVKEKVTNYVPVRMIHNAGDYNISLEKDFEIAVYFALSTKTKGSPIRSTTVPFFYVRNKQAEAQMQLDRIREIDRIKVVIGELPDEDIRVIAKGLTIKDVVIPSSKNISVQELRLALIQAATAYPKQFAEQFTSKLIRLRGMIRRAIDMGIITTSKHQITGVLSYVFAKNNELICEVPNGINNAEDFLITYMSNIDLVAQYLEKIKNFMQEDVSEKALESMDDELFSTKKTESDADLIEKALSLGAIQYDPVEMKVKSREGNTIALIEGDDWKASFVNKLSVPVTKNKFLKILREG